MAPSAVNGISNRMNAACHRDRLRRSLGRHHRRSTLRRSPARSSSSSRPLPLLRPRRLPPAAGAAGCATVRDQRARKAGAIGVLVAGLDAMSEAQRDHRLHAADRAQARQRPATSPVSRRPTSRWRPPRRCFGGPLAQLKVGTAGKSVSGKWVNEWTMSKTPGRNVIAMLPGSDPVLKDEYVLIGAHTDHVGMVGRQSAGARFAPRLQSDHAAAGRQRSCRDGRPPSSGPRSTR